MLDILTGWILKGITHNFANQQNVTCSSGYRICVYFPGFPEILVGRFLEIFQPECFLKSRNLGKVTRNLLGLKIRP
jgi:hypothetical protein